MHPREQAALADAQAFAPEAERILGVSGLEQELRVFEQDETALQASKGRDFGLGDIASIAGVLVSLVAFIHQVRDGYYLKGTSREERVHELCQRVLDRTDLPADIKERLVAKAMDKIIPDQR